MSQVHFLIFAPEHNASAGERLFHIDYPLVFRTLELQIQVFLLLYEWTIDKHIYIAENLTGVGKGVNHLSHNIGVKKVACVKPDILIGIVLLNLTHGIKNRLLI